MKRLLVLAALALGLSVVVAPAAAPAGGDAKGPPCANITGGADTASYTDTGVIDFTVQLAAPVCSIVTYTFTVTDTSGTVINPVTSTSTTDCTPEAIGGGCVQYVYQLPSGSPTTVCVYAETYINEHLVDRAPNQSDQICPASSPSMSLWCGPHGCIKLDASSSS